MSSAREIAEKLYNALPSELGRYKRHVDVIDQITTSLEQYGKLEYVRGIEDAAKEADAENRIAELHGYGCECSKTIRALVKEGV